MLTSLTSIHPHITIGIGSSKAFSLRCAGEASDRHAVDRQFMVAIVLCPQINLAEKPDGVHPKLEKYLLRKAFDLPYEPYLPDDVLFRQKEQVCRSSTY